MISGCLTKMTRIYIGRHHSRVDSVLRVSTFRRTHRFMPVKDFLNRMFVAMLKNTMNCYLGSTWTIVEVTFIRNGLSLLAELLPERRPG